MSAATDTDIGLSSNGEACWVVLRIAQDWADLLEHLDDEDDDEEEGHLTAKEFDRIKHWLMLTDVRFCLLLNIISTTGC